MVVGIAKRLARKLPSRGCKRPSTDSSILLLLMSMGAVACGIAIGVGLKYGLDESQALDKREISYLRLPGDLFLRALKMLVLPLIFCSLVNSLAGLDVRTAGRMGLIAGLYYLITIVLAVATGMILVSVMKPGSYTNVAIDAGAGPDTCKGTKAVDTILDLFRNLFPDNFVEAAFKAVATCIQFKARKNNTDLMQTLSYSQYENLTKEMRDKYMEDPFLVSKSGTNVLGIIVFALAIGTVLGRGGPNFDPLRRVMSNIEQVIMQIVHWVIWLSPIGITSLIAAQIVEMDDLLIELRRLGMYMATVLVGLLIHGGFTLQVILVLFGKRNPFKWAYGLLQALTTAFGTASSNATLPVTLKCLKENNRIDERVLNFVVPLGSTVNMNGTALYEAVAAVYISQCLGISLTVGQLILISLTSVLASVGAAGIPQAGLVTMIMVLVAANLPPQYFTLIVPVDWLLDRCRTTVNVFDDTVGCAIVERYCKEQLQKVDQSNENARRPESEANTKV